MANFRGCGGTKKTVMANKSKGFDHQEKIFFAPKKMHSNFFAKLSCLSWKTLASFLYSKKLSRNKHTKQLSAIDYDPAQNAICSYIDRPENNSGPKSNLLSPRFSPCPKFRSCNGEINIYNDPLEYSS